MATVDQVKESIRAIASDEELLAEVLKFVRDSHPATIEEDGQDELVLKLELLTADELRDVDEYVAQAKFRDFFKKLDTSKQLQLVELIEKAVPEAVEEDALNVSKLPLDFVKRAIIKSSHPPVVVPPKVAPPPPSVTAEIGKTRTIAAKKPAASKQVASKTVPSRTTAITLEESLAQQQKRVDDLLARLKGEMRELDRLNALVYGPFESSDVSSRSDDDDYEDDSY